jgi:hypothetical protein
MTKGKGWKSRLAIGLESVYGTAVAVTQAIPYLSENIAHSKERNNDESLMGDAGFNRSFVGQESNIGPLTCNLDYGNLDMFIAAAMGAADTPATVTDLYGNTYSLADEIDNSITAAIDKDVSVHEWRGIKINKLTLKGETSKPVIMEIEVVAYDRKTTGTTNNSAAIAAATVLEVPVCMFDDLTFRIGDLDDALDSGDDLCISGFELSLDNKLKTDDITNCGLDEPERDGRRVITLNVNLPSYQADTYQTYKDNNTELQVNMIFARSSDDYTDDYTIDIRLGKVLVADYQTPVDGEKMIRPALPLVALRADEDNPTWATMTEEMEIYVLNTISASPISDQTKPRYSSAAIAGNNTTVTITMSETIEYNVDQATTKAKIFSGASSSGPLTALAAADTVTCTGANAVITVELDSAIEASTWLRVEADAVKDGDDNTNAAFTTDELEVQS